jgi:hypothetical protein
MRNMSNAMSELQARRMRADQEEFADRIARAMPRDGTVEPQPGLHSAAARGRANASTASTSPRSA